MIQVMTWHDVIAQEEKQHYFQQIMTYVANARKQGTVVYPPECDVFNAFHFTKLSALKVVILGQDPYHVSGQAHGLCFSVLPGVKIPPSLMNIYKELTQDIDGFTIPSHGYLKHWTDQGILLLNTVLTVEQGNAHSHAHLGWEIFTDHMIETVNAYTNGVVFLLWGAHARQKSRMINYQRHHILEASHPSPLSAHRGFFGCGHFSQTNQLLSEMNKTPIDWQLVPVIKD
ncbi:uracil-DNA glycosylase [Candidatus Enterovibrio altilux]|uniref:Uracil-DNA glycosylase n=1 Tax=Candidatus Enterovibrio altilux TaxID=1927128 RepID=A0A291B8S9_9GAMM|nr:uracil-DNA glycosylase [Candidatus Enterovibrio luxaltus]ATF09419.1 Uracil-DNA glycosylase, family 1 [Candidatus Enterovibrio luxaltus]